MKGGPLSLTTSELLYQGNKVSMTVYNNGILNSGKDENGSSVSSYYRLFEVQVSSDISLDIHLNVDWNLTKGVGYTIQCLHLSDPEGNRSSTDYSPGEVFHTGDRIQLTADAGYGFDSGFTHEGVSTVSTDYGSRLYEVDGTEDVVLGNATVLVHSITVNVIFNGNVPSDLTGSVSINGVSIDVSSFTLNASIISYEYKVSPGPYTVHLSLDGYHSYSVSVTVTGDDSVTFYAVPEAEGIESYHGATITVVVHSSVVGEYHYSVSESGPFGLSGSFDFVLGEHTFKISFDGDNATISSKSEEISSVGTAVIDVQGLGQLVLLILPDSVGAPGAQVVLI